MQNRSEETGEVRVRPLRSIIPSLALLLVVALAGSVSEVPTVAAVGNGPPTGASIDIKPGSCPNSFSRHSNGVLPVAIVGTTDSDVLDVDVGSVLISRADGVGGSVAPFQSSADDDEATPLDGEPCDCHELEGDGIFDLGLKFVNNDVVAELQLDGLPGGALVELVVSGALLDGTPFEGSDCIQLVPCPWDLDGNGSVGVGDLLILLAEWGKPYGVPELLALLADWGPCP